MSAKGLYVAAACPFRGCVSTLSAWQASGIVSETNLRWHPCSGTGCSHLQTWTCWACIRFKKSAQLLKYAKLTCRAWSSASSMRRR